MLELEYLNDLGCYKIVPKMHSARHRLYRHWFVGRIILAGRKSSRHCVEAYNDKDHFLFTAALTMKRISMRLLVDTTVLEKVSVHMRDVTKLFIMSLSSPRQAVFMTDPEGVNVGNAKVVKVLRPVFGMPESPPYWFKNFTDYHKEVLGMKQSAIDL